MANICTMQSDCQEVSSRLKPRWLSEVFNARARRICPTVRPALPLGSFRQGLRPIFFQTSAVQTTFSSLYRSSDVRVLRRGAQKGALSCQRKIQLTAAAPAEPGECRKDVRQDQLAVPDYPAHHRRLHRQPRVTAAIRVTAERPAAAVQTKDRTLMTLHGRLHSKNTLIQALSNPRTPSNPRT
jgi:hypothetical protein